MVSHLRDRGVLSWWTEKGGYFDQPAEGSAENILLDKIPLRARRVLFDVHIVPHPYSDDEILKPTDVLTTDELHNLKTGVEKIAGVYPVIQEALRAPSELQGNCWRVKLSLEDAVDMLFAKGLVDIDAKNTDAAYQDFVEALAVCNLPKDKNGYSSLGVKCTIIRCFLPRVLRQNQLQDEQLNSIAELLKESEWPGHLAEQITITMVENVYMNRWFATHAVTRRLGEDKLTAPIARALNKDAVNKFYTMTGIQKPGIANYVEFIEKCVDAAQQPVDDRWLQYLALLQDVQKGKIRSSWILDWEILVHTNFDFFEDTEATAWIRLGRIAVAVEQFRRKKGYLPTTLEELVQTYLEKVPLDPFTKMPLVYEPHADSYTVRSKGHLEEEGESIRPDIIYTGLAPASSSSNADK